MALSSGQLLQGNYRIVRLLGQGGMGAVYLAEHTRLQGRLLAIKENTPDPFVDQATRDQLRNQFYTEAKILAALDHPNLPKVTDYFIEGGVEYLVMDFVDGENLSDLLDQHMQQQGKPLPEAQVLNWAEQILSALAYMHSRQPHPVIHRDIKPANLILTPGGVVHLVDFGLVKLMRSTDQSTAAAMRGMGTPDYTPLEQYPGSQTHTDARTDIYALGATLYHLLAGSPPVNVRDRLLGAASVVPLRQLNPSVSTNTDNAILRAIEVRPDDRFQTAEQMLAALADIDILKSAAAPGLWSRIAVLTGVSLLSDAMASRKVRASTPTGRKRLEPLVLIVAGVTLLLTLAFLGGRALLDADPIARTPSVIPSGLRISLDNTARLAQMKQFAADAVDLAWTPDSRQLLLATSSGVIMLDIGEETQTYLITSTSPSLLDVSTDGGRLVTADRQGVQVWSLMNEQASLELEVLTSPVTDLTFGNGNGEVGWSESDGLIRILNTGDETVRVLPERNKAVKTAIAFSSANRLVASSGTDQAVQLWNLAHIDYPATRRSPSLVSRLKFAPDASSLASANDDGTILLWELEDLADPRIILGHFAAVTDISFSPDGRLMVSASRDDTIRLWEVGSGLELRILKGHTGDVTSVAFSPDGRWIATLGDDNFLRLWAVR